MAGKRALPGKGLGKYLQGRVEIPKLMDKRDHFGLGYKPDANQKRKELEKKTFVSGGTVYSERRTSKEGMTEETLRNLSINAIYEEELGEGNSSGIRPYEQGSVLNNWTAEDIHVTFKVDSDRRTDWAQVALEWEEPPREFCCRSLADCKIGEKITGIELESTAGVSQAGDGQ
ncbi:hypothetical protein GOBAR_DD32501 [Gossypium barbadense]|nr:hypothetical protein GOBAR_DD32501 [Gossypium barbadense]